MYVVKSSPNPNLVWHGVGLWDIFHTEGSFVITDEISYVRCPLDWTGTANYYSHGDLATLIKQLLMYGEIINPSPKELPRGKIYGIKRVPGGGSGYDTGLTKVGLEDIKSNPVFD